jgi:hypothetical protein
LFFIPGIESKEKQIFSWLFGGLKKYSTSPPIWFLFSELQRFTLHSFALIK